MNKQSFWKPQPKEPWVDWRMHSMLVPILVSAVGFFVTGIFAFAFSDLAVIPGPVQSWAVILGSGLIVFGAELNTPFTTVEVFRKILRKEANNWDVSALVASCVGTVVNLLVTFASRLSLDPIWKGLLLNWGPLLAGFAVACDYYGSLVELGFLFGSYELRMEQWLEDRRVYNEANGIVTLSAPPPAPARADPTWRAATFDDVQRLTERLNGDRSTFDRDALLRLLADNELRFDKSRSTADRWTRVVREG